MNTGSRQNSVKLNICYWNVNGRWFFFKDSNIAQWISQFNLIFLSETHFTKGQKFDLPNYKSYHNSFSNPGDSKARWGISCFVSNSLMSQIINVDCSFENHIVVSFKEGHRVFGSYIPPSDSVYYKDEYFYAIPTFLSPIDNSRVFVGGGDMNSRVGDKLKMSGDVNGFYRPNPDTFVNSHGKILRNICQGSNCYLLNNLKYNNKAFDGKFTFERAGSRSQNDFCISNTAGLDRVSMFHIHDLSFNFSDHKPISVSLSIPVLDGTNSHVVAEDLLSNACDKIVRRQRKIHSECVDWDAYTTLANLKLVTISDKLTDFMYSKDSFDSIIDDLDNAIYKTALSCQKKRAKSETVEGVFVPENRSVLQIQSEISHADRTKWNNIITSTNPSDLWSEIAWKG